MKRLLISASLTMLLVTFPLINMAQVEVDMNFNIGDPEYYGQVDLIDNSSPQVVYADPIIVQQSAPYMYYPPIYLRVPVEYYENWPQYCDLYNACFYPVFFVVDYWYLQTYAPVYRRHYPHGRPGFTPRVHYNGRGWYEHHYDNRRNIQGGQPPQEIRRNVQGGQPPQEIRRNVQGGQPPQEIRRNVQGEQPPQEIRRNVQGGQPPHEVRQNVQVVQPPQEIRRNVQVVQPPHETHHNVTGGQNREIRQTIQDGQRREEHRTEQGGAHREER